jgi:hypothetical protein
MSIPAQFLGAMGTLMVVHIHESGSIRVPAVIPVISTRSTSTNSPLMLIFLTNRLLCSIFQLSKD